MHQRKKFLFVAASLFAAMTAINSAAAETYRLPANGSPALVAEAPPGWAGQYPAQNQLTISTADDLAILEVEMISDPALTALPLPDLARQVLRSADLSPRWTSTEPETVAGLAGQAFLLTIARDGTPVGAARLVLAKIDAGHVARLTELTIIKETSPEEEAALKALVSHLSISGH